MNKEDQVDQMVADAEVRLENAKIELSKALDILSDAKCNLCLADFEEIWGEHLGRHIWYQAGTDLLGIWKSGLTVDQKDAFVEHII